ncbi:MAG: B12-binding domain-containing radical SAM protein [Magnetococcales bacterium]|nr:B12-binding domain-containing radical SAM protein [Magnetococcales bacterium]
MADIVLVTFNARYIHTAFGLRYLKANLGRLADRCDILEFDLNRRPVEAMEQVLSLSPKIIGIGVHIWNVGLCERLLTLLKQVAPEITVVLGGPEVSHEIQQRPWILTADVVVVGEGELAFQGVCEDLLSGGTIQNQVIQLSPPDPARLALPYDLYSDTDIQNRLIYVEASRGCPYTCAFCLSALDRSVRGFDLDLFLGAMQKLMDRGVGQFKFVDRTFNLNIAICERILTFFLDRMRDGLFLHFEMIPDRLPEPLKALIQRFPAGTLQFEIGIQTFDAEVAERIGRRQDAQQAEQNLLWLRNETEAHLHTDLIIGLPGEAVDGFGAAFDRLTALDPHEIQVGILKRLPGAPISEHSEAFGMVYDAVAPYEILCNNLIDFDTMQRLKRFARYWDMIGNSGRFRTTKKALFCGEGAYQRFSVLSAWIYTETGQTHRIALRRLYGLVLRGLMDGVGVDGTTALEYVSDDFKRSQPGEPVLFLDDIVTGQAKKQQKRRSSATLVSRQKRHTQSA